jgi:hypothetical protein
VREESLVKQRKMARGGPIAGGWTRGERAEDAARCMWGAARR